jgi:hypothetical protein
VSDHHSDVSCPDVYRVLSFLNSLDSKPGGGWMIVAKWSGICVEVVCAIENGE